jgi:CubicO group peptidase (beta-lactamase class C family)
MMTGRAGVALLFYVCVVAGTGAAQLKPGIPASAGISESRLNRAAQLLEAEVKAKQVGAAAIVVARDGKVVLSRGFGTLAPTPGSPPVTADSVFLLASITKPVTACALMLLVERGMLSLEEPASRYLPEFTGDAREKIRVRDLLSHTSGLPDMLPENIDLRRKNAPLGEFVRRTYTTPLLFPPGTNVRYQSMGILLAGEIVEKLTGMRLRDFERSEIFEPLGMKSSSLGLGKHRIADTVWCPVSPKSDPADTRSFGANSPYWRDIGHPWGGMHSTANDLAILLQTFLDGGAYGGKRVFSPVTVRAMTADQNGALGKPWGLGWALGRSSEWNCFGDLVSPRMFGHAGATGTVAWADPETRLLCVILTNRPISQDKGRLLRLVSNAVAAAVEN